VSAFEILTANAAGFAVRGFAAWHIDPDRRVHGRRTTRVELHEPGPEVIDRLRAERAEGAAKLAPAATLPDAWPPEAELEWISRDGECRQLVCWFGGLAQHAGRRRATILDRHTNAPRSVIGGASDDVPIADSLGAYLYEPDAAVLAAGLTATLAEEHNLAAITPAIAYLTGDRPIVDAALACFQIDEVLPFDLRQLRGALRQRQIGRLEIKKRGVACEPERLRRELKLAGDAAATLIVLPIRGRPTAILAQRAS
jgi:hypothetical protein